MPHSDLLLLVYFNHPLTHFDSRCAARGPCLNACGCWPHFHRMLQDAIDWTGAHTEIPVFAIVHMPP